MSGLPGLSGVFLTPQRPYSEWLAGRVIPIGQSAGWCQKLVPNDKLARAVAYICQHFFICHPDSISYNWNGAIKPRSVQKHEDRGQVARGGCYVAINSAL